MAPLLLQLNGERAVVLLYICQILFSTPLSLLSQAFSLSLLTLFALSVEISADDPSNPLSQFFKTRPGVTSGIMLGAMTLPGLMVSRLIQVSRLVSLHEAEVGELEYLNLQYWAASAICFAVLLFICFIFRLHHTSAGSTCSLFNRDTKFGVACMALFIGICYMSFLGKTYGGLSATLIILWVLCHGLAAVYLIQNILRTFSACFSVGEGLLVTAGFVIYFGDMLFYIASKIPGYWVSSNLVFLENGIKRDEIHIIIQGITLGLLLFPVFYRYVLKIWQCSASSSSSQDMSNHEIRRSFSFCALLAFMLAVAVPSWMQFVHDFHMHPLLWVFNFVFSEPLKRLSLCVYWVAVIYVSVIWFYNISKKSTIERILLRKYYHLMAVSIFVPALIFQPKFLDLAFGAALAVFLMLEIIRVWRIWPLGHLVHKFMNAFTDHRDSDLLIVSHFSLLLGCALPIWLSSGVTDRPLAPFAGILSLGIGDTMASMVGHKYGVIRLSKTGKKTIEGTAAGITSVLAACSVLLPLLASTGYIFTMHWFSLILSVTTSGLLEAYTAQLDNAFIPLVFYSLLCL
ncbi:dolichol kinase EVAN-like [Olea europaea var. sylvestris]|uniref:dolichol kinase EVAN-like n=1 Tax=Olea europaea var. sylvestris TaxID=158386 RepID=UPI000C1D0B35|nr:dolichol kinase EVAN-like [Olea europaea var. sylvestris]